jgi:putative RNA 2'-phosphotransferase
VDPVRLSKRLSYVLRHAPWEFELELDDEGWVSIDQLLDGLREVPAYREVTREEVERLVANQTKRRFEIAGERIRALYGHSVPGRLAKEASAPPERLLHGTAARFLAEIRADGLRPMRRQYVHLSVDEAMARQVGSRKGPDVVVLVIRTGEAARAGVPFYRGSEQVWLADHVPPEWIDFPS